MNALGKTWHPEHFFCTLCGKHFGDEGFHEKDGKAYCREDYYEKFAPKCNRCKRAIMESFITALRYTWHPECFNCLVSYCIHLYIPMYVRTHVQYLKIHQCSHMPLWPNGEGIGLLSQGLWVRVPPGALCFFIPLIINNLHKETVYPIRHCVDLHS